MAVRLSLRTRLVAGLVLVAVVVVGAALVITATTRRHLVAQVDDQLLAASDPARNWGFREASGSPPQRLQPPELDRLPALPERLSPMFEGLVTEDGGLQTFFEPNLPGQQFSAPALEWDGATTSTDVPFTVGSIEGDVRYRTVAVDVGDGQFVRALPLSDVDETMARLIQLEIIALAILMLALGAVAWWVIHLGIRPIKAMTESATRITDADLSIRVPEPAATGTEAGALARALNTMLHRIEVAVTDQRQTEDRLRRFVADASHELRTPLTTIRGYAELYRHGALEERANLDDAMRRTHQEADRMGRLVEQMLALAKLDNDVPVTRTDIDIGQLVSDAAGDARVTSPEHEFEVVIEPGLRVHGVEDRLRQVLANVFANSITHTPPGTAIVATTRREGQELVVEISDDGPGIGADHLARITERFYRVDPSRSRATGGSGLGLSIAQAMMVSNGGSLLVTSDEGVGTTVTLRLPAAVTGRSTTAGVGTDSATDSGTDWPEALAPP